MSGISSNVGLISGIDTAALIGQLMQLEARPIQKIETRITGLETQKAAWNSLSMTLLNLQTTIKALESPSSFRTSQAVSSDPGVLKATAGSTAALGNYQFTVRRLVQTHQMISAGFTNADTTPIGAGTMTLEMGQGRLDRSTELSFLNGQQGVRQGTIRITDRAGVSADLDLTDAITVTDVLRTINEQPQLGVHARAVGGRIVLSDTTGQAGTISVGDVGGGSMASDLGIAGSAANADLVGRDVLSITRQTSLSLLNDGNGIERAPTPVDINITLGDGTNFKVNLLGSVVVNETTTDHTARTVGDVLDAINNALDADGNANEGRLVATLGEGNRIVLRDTTASGPLAVADGEGSRAATQLGLAGTHDAGTAAGTSLIAGLDSVLVHNLGGGTAQAGRLLLQDRSGASAELDLSHATSVTEVIEAINQAGLNLRASLNAAGNGLVLTDTTASPTGSLRVVDVTGNLAAVMGLAGETDQAEVHGGNAQHRYVSMDTRLTSLNGGEGITPGQFTITSRSGTSATVNIPESVKTIGDVIRRINSQAPDGVTARVNDAGNGIVLEDASEGAGTLRVKAASGSTTAAELGLLGESAAGEAFIEGSFRKVITIGPTDTLKDLVERINESGANVSAGIINDGSATSPYRLILSSNVSGSAGEIVLDTGQSGLRMTTFVEPRDALVYLGSPGGSQSIMLTSSTNTLENVLTGVRIDLLGTSSQPVSLNVSRDTEAIVSGVKSFVDAFNSVVDVIDKFTAYNDETKERGALFGDSTVHSIRMRLMDMVMGSSKVSGSFNNLGQVGFSLESGNRLSFDAERFGAALKQDREGVVKLFTEHVTETDDDGNERVVLSGVARQAVQMIERFTDSFEGLINTRTDGLDKQTQLLRDRIGSLSRLLSAKRQRLERQFTAMETALAQLQGQQGSLSALAQMANSFGNRK